LHRPWFCFHLTINGHYVKKSQAFAIRATAAQAMTRRYADEGK
jgi:hypothetical protein